MNPAKEDMIQSAASVGSKGLTQAESFSSPAFLGLKTGDSWQARISKTGKEAFKKNQFLHQETRGKFTRVPEPTAPAINTPPHNQQQFARELLGVFPQTGAQPARPKTGAARPSPRTQNLALNQLGRPMTSRPNGVRDLADATGNMSAQHNLSAGALGLAGGGGGGGGGGPTNRLNNAFSTTYPANDPGKSGLRPAQYARPPRTPGNQPLTQRLAGTGVYNPAIESPRPGAGTDPISRPVQRKEFQPHFVEYDRQVLAFYGYYLDKNSFESTTLGYPTRNGEVVRRVVVYYHLEDGSVAVNEQKQENSGRVQGTLHRRAVAYHPDGTLFVPGDFRVGGQVKLSGLTFHLVDANAVARTFMKKSLGVEVPAALPYPGDESDLRHLRAEHTTGLGGVRAINHYNRLGQDVAKAKRMTIFADAHHAQIGKERKFLQHDRHVLRFQALWRDPAPNGKEHQFTVLYFLADDTVEIRTVKERNAGRDDYPCLLRRCKLPKAWVAARTSAETVRKGDEGNVTELDLRCGGKLDVYGRELLLVSCDGFTREFYRTEYDLDQVDLDMTPPPRAAVTHAIPRAGDGFLALGREEDNMKTVYGMRAPGKTAEQIFNERGRLVRGLMRLVDDPAREFSMTFNCETKELALYELEKKNCGRVTGKFVRSDRYYNPEATDDIPEGQSGRYYKASDFYLGAVMKLHTANVMEVVDLDESSLNYMEGDPKSFPLSDYQGFVAPKVLRNLVQGPAQGRDLRQELLAHDPEGRGVLPSQAAFEAAADELGLLEGLTAHERGTVFRRFAEKAQGAALRAGERRTPLRARGFVWPLFLDSLVRAHRRAAGFEGPSGFPARLCVAPLLWRQLLAQADRENTGSMPLDGLDALFSVRRQKFTQRELEEISQQFATPEGLVDYNAFCDAIYPAIFP